MEFTLSKDQELAYSEFHKHKCQTIHATVGGRISVRFTPTALGDIVTLRCRCGEVKDISETIDW